MAAYTNIDDPSAHFQIKTGVGASNPQSITFDGNSDLQPDMLWWKRRDADGNHHIHDSTRGTNKFVYPDLTNGEGTNSTIITSFDTDGWSTGSNWFDLGSQTWAVWAWKANGGTTSSNTDGTITTTTQANTTAGFSIATWTGNGTNGATIGHGNGGIPNGYIVKRLDATSDWGVGGGYTGNVWVGGTSAVIHLNTNGAVSEAYNNYWGSSFPNSQVLPLSQNAEINASGGSYVGYFFRNIQGYSKLGKYTGNGNANGPFIYTGFKPAFVMIKKTNGTSAWIMYDNKRNSYTGNYIHYLLQADVSSAEVTNLSYPIDFLSNGFKPRGTSLTNDSGGSYMYMAFAESPFVTSTGVPTTAR